MSNRQYSYNMNWDPWEPIEHNFQPIEKTNDSFLDLVKAKSSPSLWNIVTNLNEKVEKRKNETAGEILVRNGKIYFFSEDSHGGFEQEIKTYYDLIKAINKAGLKK